MLNRMCSEAELAVGMQSMISSSKRANVTLLLAPFGDGFVSFDLPQVPFPSVTPHAVKHSSPPSGTGLTPICYTPELRMNRERPSFALQKAANRTLKGRLLKRKRRPFASVLTVSELLAGQDKGLRQPWQAAAQAVCQSF